MKADRNLFAVCAAFIIGATATALPAVAPAKAQCRLYPRRQRRLRRSGSLRRRRAARLPDTKCRPACARGAPPHAVPRGTPCTPSRSALMTGQYSIRNGLSLAAIPGTPNQLSANAYTMGQLFKDAGYATAIFGKWHLGSAPQSLPSAHGFDEFYGIPPDTSWNDEMTVSLIMVTHSIDAPESTLIEKGPWIDAAEGGRTDAARQALHARGARGDRQRPDRPLHRLHQTAAAAGKPFFLYFPFSMGHAPNTPSKQFAGKSRIGNYGDKMMEGDYHVGQVLDTLKELNIDNNTIVVFASDNGPCGWILRELGNLGTPDMGNAGPFRGELGEATEGSIRTFCFIRWPGHIETGHLLLRHVLDNGFPADFRGHPWRQTANRSCRSTAWTRRRCFSARARRARASRCSPSSARIWWLRAGSNGASTSRTCSLTGTGPADARRHVHRKLGRSVLPEGLQHRDGPARGFECRRHQPCGRCKKHSRRSLNIRRRSRSIQTHPQSTSQTLVGAAKLQHPTLAAIHLSGEGGRLRRFFLLPCQRCDRIRSLFPRGRRMVAVGPGPEVLQHPLFVRCRE